MVGSFLSTSEEIESTLAANRKREPLAQKIRLSAFFHVTSIVSSTPRKHDTGLKIVCRTITIDD